MICLNFSGRITNGNGREICNVVKEQFKTNVHIFNISNFNMHPCNKCSYECLQKLNCPYESDDAKKLYDTLLAADIILFIIPIFGDYPCSNYFIFRERMQSYFNEANYERYEKIRKKFMVIGNTGYENVVSIIKNDYNISKTNDFLFLSSNDVHTKSVLGNLMNYPIMKEKVINFVSQIVQ